jgi:hypothetical protein
MRLGHQHGHVLPDPHDALGIDRNDAVEYVFDDGLEFLFLFMQRIERLGALFDTAFDERIEGVEFFVLAFEFFDQGGARLRQFLRRAPRTSLRTTKFFVSRLEKH